MSAPSRGRRGARARIDPRTRCESPSSVADWPESWRLSYHYDVLEVFGGDGDPAYSSASVRHSRTLDLMRRVASPGARILDVAAGQGNFTLALAELGYDVTWNDMRSELVGYVELKREGGAVTYRPGNVFELSDDQQYDVVLAAEVIEHVAHPDALLVRLAALTRRGGHVVVTTPNGGFVRNPLPRFSDVADPSRFEETQFGPDASGHLWLLGEDELSQLAAGAGLVVERVSYFTSPLTAGWLDRPPPDPPAAAGGARCERDPAHPPARPLRRRLATHLSLLLAVLETVCLEQGRKPEGDAFPSPSDAGRRRLGSRGRDEG